MKLTIIYILAITLVAGCADVIKDHTSDGHNKEADNQSGFSKGFIEYGDPEPHDYSLMVDTGALSAQANTVMTNSNESEFVTCSRDKTARSFDISTGKEIKKFLWNTTDNSGNCRDIALSHDDKLLYVAVEGQQQLLVFSYSTEKIIRSIPVGKGKIGALDISSDNKYIAITQANPRQGWDASGGEVIILDAKSGSVVKRFAGGWYDIELFKVKDEYFVVSVDADSSVFFGRLSDAKLRKYNLRDVGEFSSTYFRYKLEFIMLDYSKQRNEIAVVGSGNNVVFVWSLDNAGNLRFDRTIKTGSKMLNSVSYSKNGANLLLSSTGVDCAEVYDKADRLIASASRSSKCEYMWPTVITNNEKVIGIGHDSKSLIQWDLKKKGAKPVRINSPKHIVQPKQSVAFDGKYLAWGTNYCKDKAAGGDGFDENCIDLDHVMDLETMRVSDGLNGLRFNRVSEKNSKHYILLGDFNESNKKKIFRLRPRGSNNTVSFIDIFPEDGWGSHAYGLTKNLLISANREGHLIGYDIMNFGYDGGYQEHKRIVNFIGHTSDVMSIATHGSTLVSADRSGEILMWKIPSRETIKSLSGRDRKQMNVYPIFRFIIDDVGNYLVVTSSGYFSGSTALMNKVWLHKNSASPIGTADSVGLNQLYDTFYRPDIVKAALAGKDTSSMVTLTIDEATKNPPPMIEKVEAPASSKADKIKVSYQIKSEGGGIGEVRIFHNGKLVKSDGFIRNAPTELFARNAKELTGIMLEGQMRSLSVRAKRDQSFKRITETVTKPDLYQSFVEIEPIPGENEIAIIAFNAQNSVQSLTKTVTFKSDKAPVKPRLHILAVGIDQYKDAASNLKYAVKDSTDMASKLKAQAASIYGAENIFVETISNAEASRAGVLAKINQVAGNVKPTDHFVLFVASHGVLLGDQYYMVTNDYDGTLDPSKLISSNEIVDLSKQIKALSQLYILDTCHAGGMDGVVSGLYDARMSVLAKKMGLHVFASSNSVEQALDGYKGNGLFTHTLLDALNNNQQADKNSDKNVSLIELGSYSKAETKQIAEGLGHAQEPLIINFGQDNPVYTLH